MARPLGWLRVLGVRVVAGALRPLPDLVAAAAPSPPLTRSDGRAAGRVLGDVAPLVAEGRVEGVPEGRAEGVADGRVPGESDRAVAEGRDVRVAAGDRSDGGVLEIAGLAVAPPRVGEALPVAATGVGVGVPDRRAAVLTPERPGSSL